MVRDGKKRCTLVDLAKQTGVNPSTVSRVLNGHATKIKVTESKQAEIRELAAKLDYVPNINAHRLWSSKTRTIGLAAPLQQFSDKDNILQHSSFLEMLEGIQNAIGEFEYFLLLVPQNRHYYQDRTYLKLLKQRVIDALIIWGASFEDDYFASLAQEKCLLLNTLPKEVGVDYFIGHDDRAAFAALMEHYIRLGKRRFLYIGENGRYNSIGQQRCLGFRDAMNRHGLDDSQIYPCNFDRSCAREIFERILVSCRQNRNKCDIPVFEVVAAASDDLAYGIFEAAAAAGLEVPRDLIITGAGSMGMSFPDHTAIPTYALPNYQMGYMAVEKAIELSSCSKLPPSYAIRLPYSLQV